jgi:exonuclease III
MIVLTMNIRGLGSRVKKRKIRELVQAEKVEFLALQETKSEDISESLIHSLWGGDDCDWVHLPATGNSGGILSIWRKSLFSIVFSFTGNGFVGVCIDVVQDLSRCYVINVYAKCNLSEKRRLWREILMSKRGFGGECWCIVGDFNSVRDRGKEEALGQLWCKVNLFFFFEQLQFY